MVEVALELMGGEVKECKGVRFNKEKKQCCANTKIRAGIEMQ